MGKTNYIYLPKPPPGYKYILTKDVVDLECSEDTLESLPKDKNADISLNMETNPPEGPSGLKFYEELAKAKQIRTCPKATYIEITIELPDQQHVVNAYIDSGAGPNTALPYALPSHVWEEASQPLIGNMINNEKIAFTKIAKNVNFSIIDMDGNQQHLVLDTVWQNKNNCSDFLIGICNSETKFFSQ